MLERLKVLVYRALPRWLRAPAVRWATPNFTVGAIGLVTDDGERLLLARLSYRKGWWPPGGFLAKGESAEVGLAREYAEELGLEVTFDAPHRVFLDPERCWVTFLSVGVLTRGQVPLPRGPEVREARWFPIDALPEFSQDFRECVTEEDLQALRAARPGPSGPAGPSVRGRRARPGSGPGASGTR